MKIWEKSMRIVLIFNNQKEHPRLLIFNDSSNFFSKSQECSPKKRKVVTMGGKVSCPIDSSLWQRASFKRNKRIESNFPCPLASPRGSACAEDQWDIPCLTVRHAFSRRPIPTSSSIIEADNEIKRNESRKQEERLGKTMKTNWKKEKVLFYSGEEERGQQWVT